jgi:hypothetical protein
VRKAALVALMILSALVAPIAVPIRIVVLHLRRESKKTEFVVRDERVSDLELPETVSSLPALHDPHYVDRPT